MSFPRSYRRTRTERASNAGDESRVRLLEVALDLFAASGFRGTSIAQVAERAGLSQSGLLHHFPTKAALLTAALEYRDEVDGGLLETAQGPALGWAAFEALVDLAERNRSRPEVVRLFVSICAEAIDPEHPAHDWILGHYEGIRSWLRAALEHGIAAGQIHPDVPVDELISQTIAMQDGLQIQWLVNGAQTDPVAGLAEFIGGIKERWSTRG
ncbi:TetR/AcrR family transcriptional regulator [Arthrobacter sp. MMS24-S77]